ncbi:geranylgeranyl transferase type-1 subunit beta-like [Rhopilema esculentum]|uniref:geranylgeranyl transferase type-1 subunit beta-like n=1 Tax=Rhopilema esculentum TaxID=499914 RepID=UPI0031E0847C
MGDFDVNLSCQRDLQIAKHIKFMERTISILPCEYGYFDSSRITILFFALSGLDILNALDRVEEDKQDMINWIYAQQIVPSFEDDDASRCGFRGASYFGGSFNPKGVPASLSPYEEGHIAMTYTALCCLLILGDDLSRVNKKAIVAGLKAVQLDNGSFMPVKSQGENDMRFIYCACCISHIIDDWGGINVEKVIKYIRDSWSYDHGFGQGPSLESHGGSTFCAIASLILMGKLSECFREKEIDKIKRWCILRQKSGFQGRPNKPVDTCYSFWVGASLQLLGASELIEKDANREYLMGTQHATVGGFSKWPDFHPDVLHTYFGLCGLSLMSQPGLLSVDAALSISERAKDHLERLHALWR